MKKSHVKGLTSFAAALLGVGLMALPAASATAAPIPGAGATTTPAANLRLTLDTLLGAHAILAQLAMQAGYSGAPDYTGLVTQLNQNTQELSAAIASVYGQAAGAEFDRLWTGHIVDFVDYVVASKDHNAAAQQTAVAALHTYEHQFAAFMAKADPHMSSAVLAASLQVHVNQLLATFNAYRAGQYTLAAKDFVTAYQHMFMDGDYFATEIVNQFPAKFGHTSPNTPAVDLRANLSMLLAAHAALAQWAMQAGYEGAPDFSSVAGVLTDNTTALSSAIAGVYGKAAGATFDRMWTGHIVDFVDYVTATKAHNAKDQAAAVAALETYKTQFSAFLAGADPHMSSAQLAASLQVHITQLLTTFKANTQGRYNVAAMDYVTAYDHMFMDGTYLSTAIVEQFPGRFGLK